MTRKLLSFAGSVQPADPAADPNTYIVAMVVGDGVYNGVLVPTDELGKAADTFDHQPLNIDHSWRVEDEVGFIDKPVLQGKVLRAMMHLNPKTAKYAVAKAYIDNRVAAGTVPEVSIGFYCDVDEAEDGAFVARDMKGDHLALVTRGACSPEDGAGVGLSRKQEVENMDKKDESAAPGAGKDGAAPAAPAPATMLKADHEKALADMRSDYEAKIATLQADHKAVADELRVYQSHELAGLKNEAVALGLPVKDADTIASLKEKVADAKAVLAKANKDAPVTTRFTRPVTESATPEKEARVDRIASLAGVPRLD